MELMQLKYFMEVAESSHVTQSAERLHIAQPALTQAIRRLEGDLGVPLFVRRGRNIMLTEYGEYFRRCLSPIMAELDALPARLHEMAQLEDTTIHLNVLAATTFTADAVLEFRRLHPEYRFQLIQNTKNARCDVEITTRLFYHAAVPSDGHQHVCTERIFLAVPNTGRYSGARSVRLADMRGENFISLFGSKQLRSICDKFCTQAGFAPSIGFESDSPAVVRNMIAANMGVGFWPEFTWGAVDTNHVRLLEIEDADFTRDILLTFRSDKINTANAKKFFWFLVECFDKKRVPGVETTL